MGLLDMLVWLLLYLVGLLLPGKEEETVSQAHATFRAGGNAFCAANLIFEVMPQMQALRHGLVRPVGGRHFALTDAGIAFLKERYHQDVNSQRGT